ncbi:MAG: hypothetical protein WBW08_04640 [Methyloceanibacter sp.]
MTDNHHLHVEVQGDDIIITMPDTGFRVVYRKPHLDPGLVAKLDYFPEEQKGPIPHTEFFALAQRLANAKARELGWIV